MNKYMLIWILALCMTNCSNYLPNDVDSSAIEKAIYQIADQHTVDVKNVKAFAIIPQGGCEGCISTAESFTIDHAKNNPDIRFIYTEVNSNKLLKNRLGKAYFYENVYIDNHRSFANLRGDYSIYPMILYLDKGKIDHIVFQNPQNENAFDQLLILTE